MHTGWAMKCATITQCVYLTCLLDKLIEELAGNIELAYCTRLINQANPNENINSTFHQRQIRKMMDWHKTSSQT